MKTKGFNLTIQHKGRRKGNSGVEGMRRGGGEGDEEGRGGGRGGRGRTEGRNKERE